MARDMSNVILKYEGGWACSTKASVRTQVHKEGEEFKKRNIADIGYVFEVGEPVKAGSEITLLVRDGGERKCYRAKVLGRAKSTALRLHLLKSEGEDRYNEILEQIKGGQ